MNNLIIKTRIMKKWITLMVCLVALTTSQAQRGNKINGNGKTVTLERQVGDYSDIAVGGFFDVELVDGPEGGITLSGSTNIGVSVA
jgi:hypothetical protein